MNLQRIKYWAAGVLAVIALAIAAASAGILAAPDAHGAPPGAYQAPIGTLETLEGHPPAPNVPWWQVLDRWFWGPSSTGSSGARIEAW